MKKALLCGLSAAMLLALVLVACNKPQADQPTEPDPPPTPSAVQTEPVETPEPEETNEPVNQVEQMSVNSQQEVDTRRLATEEELLNWFEISYEFGQIFANTGYSEEDVLAEELFRLNGFIEITDEFRVPDDVEVQYLTWRLLNHSQEPETTEAPASNPQINSNQTQPVNAETGGSGTGGTTQTSTNTQQGSLVQSSSGDLGVDVTGGRSPNDFINKDYGTEAKDSNGYLDMSKVGFGN